MPSNTSSAPTRRRAEAIHPQRDPHRPHQRPDQHRAPGYQQGEEVSQFEQATGERDGDVLEVNGLMDEPKDIIDILIFHLFSRFGH